jgi:hypothetical protein
MSVIDMKHELASTVARLDKSNVRQARLDLAQLEREINQQLSEKTIDAETTRACRLTVANIGLEISQYLIPALNELAVLCFEFSGKGAVRTACAAITRGGATGHDGQPLPPIPSAFTLPDGY